MILTEQQIINAVRKVINEVRYLGNKIEDETPLMDSETIRVYHGFNSFKDAVKVLERGLSGRERAARIYSYEIGNNPYGLFVTTDFKMAKSFSHSGVIIEFSTKVSDLEAPVWVGGRSYYVQGEYTQSFKDMDEREQQRLINRQKSGESPYDQISKSDRPELADTIFNNSEKQALYKGDLNPNMIKRVWYNERLHKERLTNGNWVKLSRNEFMKKVPDENKEKYDRWIKYKPNDNFDFDEFVELYLEGDLEENIDTLEDILWSLEHQEYQLRQTGFFPKQIEQLKKLNNEGFFDDIVKKR